MWRKILKIGVWVIGIAIYIPTFYILSVIVLIFMNIIFNSHRPLPDANSFQLYKRTPVWEFAKAVRDEDCEKIAYWVQDKNIPIDTPEERFGQTLLILAAINNKHISVRKLLELGADPNIHNTEREYTPLIYAMRYSDIEIVELMLGYGADPNLPSKTYDNKAAFTPLWAASFQEDKLKLLLSAGANINQPTHFDNGSLVSNALRSENYDIALMLIDNGHICNQRNKAGQYYVVEVLKSKIHKPGSEMYYKKQKVVRRLEKMGIHYHWSITVPWNIDNLKRERPDDWKEWLYYDRMM